MKSGGEVFASRRLPGRGSGFQAPGKPTVQAIAPPRLAGGLYFVDAPDEAAAPDALGDPHGFPDPPDAPDAPDLLVKD